VGSNAGDGAIKQLLSVLMFFPRGGSAHAARGLAECIGDYGWRMRLVAGSRADLGESADARAFYAGLDVVPVDYTSELDSRQDRSPLRGALRAPLHPSYEEKPGAPDRVFAALDDAEHERHVAAWAQILERADAASADALHLHHLTPAHEAAARVAPDIPVIGQLHGTELLMLERATADPPRSWTYAERWVERMRGWARRCERIVVAPGAVERASDVLGLERERFAPIPNGYDDARFRPLEVDRARHWRRHLVEAPLGSLPGGEEGTVRYDDAQIRALADAVVIAYVGRFTEVKRVPLLIRAFVQARERFRRPAGLALIGGYPGEYEGEHPADAIAAVQADDVFLAGWHPHDTLPAFLAASDLIVLPSVREQFGQALVEGMACGLPAIAAESFGSRAIVEDGNTGWLVPPDDEVGLIEALVEAVNDESERRRRGRLAWEAVRIRYSWSSVAGAVAQVLDEVVERKQGHARQVAGVTSS
jgi:glycosyltransferase involved in cell wall biosynthesis